MPIFVFDSIYGFIGFDIIDNLRLWDEFDMSSLKLALKIIGISIERKQTYNLLKKSEQRFREKQFE